MKKVFCLYLLSVVFSTALFSVAGTSKSIGPLVINPTGSERLLKEALEKPLSQEWIEKYTTQDEAFIVSYAVLFQDLLPMENFIMSRVSEREIRVKEVDKDTVYTFILDQGKISALGIF